MHSTERPLAIVEGNIALDYMRIQPVLFEFPLAKASCEKSSVVRMLFYFHHKRAWQLGLSENQYSPTL